MKLVKVLLSLSFILAVFSYKAQTVMGSYEEEGIYMPLEEEFISYDFYSLNRGATIPVNNIITLKSAEAGQWVWPTDDYYPITCVYLCYEKHHAIDLYAKTGASVYASRDGVVEQIVTTCPNISANQKECGGGYGNYITIKHDTGVYSRYAHLDSVYVKKGQKVSMGQKIGTIGTSGRVGAAHLHFEIRENSKGMSYGGWDPLDSSRFQYILPKELGQKPVTTWVNKSGSWYYTVNGIAQTGWLNEKGLWYYLNTNGVMQTGWTKDAGSWYYLNSGGVMQTGWVKDAGSWYYLNSGGVMQTGWVKDAGSWYYLNSGGVMQTGWVKDAGSWYYLNASGVMQTSGIKDGWEIHSNGVATPIDVSKNGWEQVSSLWYFYENGTKKTGWFLEGNTWYYLNTKGEMQTGWQTINNESYYFNLQGQMQTGWLSESGNTYYLNLDGARTCGWKLVQNEWYYFSSEGKMLKNTIVDNWTLNEKGIGKSIPANKTGWVSAGPNWYYYTNGLMSKGWIKDGQIWYHLSENGTMNSNMWITDGKTKYYVNAQGKMVTGWNLIQNQWYIFDGNGVLKINDSVDGWVISESGIAYRKGEINADYVINKSIARLSRIGYTFNPDLYSANSKNFKMTGTPGYDEALTEAVIVEIIERKASEFYVVVTGNTANVYYR